MNGTENTKTVVLDGNSLKIHDIARLISDSDVQVEIAAASMRETAESRDFLDSEISKKIIYGVNTGFGPMASHLISGNNLERLQENLIKSHAVGIGDPINEKYVLAAMVVRLNTLAKGYSGVSPDLLLQLQSFVNNRIIPIVPEHGAVGTSGDLVQLAHIALALIGEGEVFYQGKRQETKDVFKQLGIEPYTLKAKEGLALINGTSAMSGVAAVNALHSQQLLDIAVANSGFALELVRAHEDCINEKLHEVRPHEGQVKIAEKLREILSFSHMMRDRSKDQDAEHISEDVRKLSETVQEIYSFRCVPQILGPVHDSLQEAVRVIEIEINSSSDNPIVDQHSKSFLHGGNFHGDYISFAMDTLKMSMVKLTMLSERRLNFFLNEKLNLSFPPFLNLATPGLTLGLQGLQFVATSTTSQSQTLSFPQYVHSIPTNGDNQDIVSMGMESSLLCARVIDNAYIVLSIECIALTQVLDITGAHQDISESSKIAYEKIRSVFPKVVEDRVLVKDLPRVVRLLKGDIGL